LLLHLQPTHVFIENAHFTDMKIVKKILLYDIDSYFVIEWLEPRVLLETLFTI